MRVLVLHDDDDGEAQTIQKAVCQCWGGQSLVQMEIVRHGKALLSRLAAPSRWPDMILAAWRVLEREPGLLTCLTKHPGRGFFRMLIIANGSDEYGRAVLRQATHDIVLAPVTAERLVAAMTSHTEPHRLR